MKIPILVALILTYIPTQAFELDENWKNGASISTITVCQKYYSFIQDAYYLSPQLPASFIAGIVVVESHGVSTKVGKRGEIGLGQIIPEEAEADLRRLYPDQHFYGDLKDPVYNLYVLMWYLKALRSHYGFPTMAQALAAYNMGPTKAKAQEISYADAHHSEYVKKVSFAAGQYPSKETCVPNKT